jgi:DNA-binding MarR family transcriptional regulator
MKVSRTTVIAAAAVGLIGVTSATALAATTSNAPQNSLAQDIANKFHLNQSDVQAVIDQHKQAAQQNREAKYEDRLTQAVKDGKLTEAQKKAVLAEHNKLMDEIKSSNNSADNRQTMQTVRKEAQDWAKQNNIDVSWLMPPMRGMHHMMDNNAQ